MADMTRNLRNRNDTLTLQWMKDRIDYSNSQAAQNRNVYPIQEQATQMELWERVPCTCGSSCTCRKYGCTHHWKLKKGVAFEVFRDGMLRMFVDRMHHGPIIRALSGDRQVHLSSRARGAFHVLEGLQRSWPDISGDAGEYDRTLFCDDWVPKKFREMMVFPVQESSIYSAKQFCVLFPDTGVLYDTASRTKMLRFLGLSGVNYLEFLTAVRTRFLTVMDRENLTIPAVKRLDTPGNQLPFDAARVSLPRPGTDYGSGYFPQDRTLSLVIDKCFYQPKSREGISG